MPIVLVWIAIAVRLTSGDNDINFVWNRHLNPRPKDVGLRNGKLEC